MAVEIEKSESCRAPVHVAFEYVADYRNIPHWMFGVEQFTPVGENDYGPGSVFDVKLQLGVPIKTRIEAVAWEQDRLIGMDSVKGFKARSRWAFAADGPDRTTITAHVTYELPFGPAGKAMGKVMEPVVKRAVSYAADKLRTQIEECAARG